MKKKIPFKKNVFTLGFEPGFTKALLRAGRIQNQATRRIKNKVTVILGPTTNKLKRH